LPDPETGFITTAHINLYFLGERVLLRSAAIV
jgi:hypothetical protein